MTMFNKVTKTFQWGEHTVTMETGEIARQASGAVLVNIDDTVVLATVVASKNAKPGQDFFPLTVDYIEKTYAAGKIPGSFFKREAKPSELETLTSRLIDRPIRPLFPEGFYNEVHVVIHTISLNPEVDADIAAMIATSAALAVSGIPFNGPIGAARVGYVNGEYVLNPGPTQLKSSKLDLVVAGTEAAVLMVEYQWHYVPATLACLMAGALIGATQGYFIAFHRIPAFIVVIASFVTVVEMLMKAYTPPLYEALGVFIPLIVVNCIILGRAEAFASKNTPLDSVLDGVGIGLGFTLSLTAVGAVREILGSGAIFGISLGTADYMPLIFVLAPGAFLVLGYLMVLFNKLAKK